MNIIRVKPQELVMIGEGDEGKVYRHKNRYAVKLFSDYYTKRNRMESKMRKVQEMTAMQDPSFTFPIGLVTTNGYTATGYYTRYIGGKRSFNSLSFDLNREKVLRILLETEAALKRIHKKGIFIGDLKEDNILLDNHNHPIFIDTDNYSFDNHPFDLLPMRVGCLYDLYGGKIMNFEDNDKLLFALMSLEKLTKDPRFRYGSSKRDIEQALKEHSCSPEAKEVLDCIFSDAENKPDIGPILQKVV